MRRKHKLRSEFYFSGGPGGVWMCPAEMSSWRIGITEGSKEGKSVYTCACFLFAPSNFLNDFYKESTVLGTQNSKVNHTGNALDSAELTSNQERRGDSPH